MNYALVAVFQAITNFQNLISPEIERMVLLALNVTADFSNPETETATAEYEEKLSIRKNSARLAYEFYSFYEHEKQEIPQEILEWKKICESEKEFAEIRIQWSASRAENFGGGQ